MAEIFPFLDKNLGLLPDVAAEDVAAVKFYKEFQKVLLKSAGRTHKLVLGGLYFQAALAVRLEKLSRFKLGRLFFSLSKTGQTSGEDFFFSSDQFLLLSSQMRQTSGTIPGKFRTFGLEVTKKKLHRQK